jgi:ribosomal protein S25
MNVTPSLSVARSRHSVHAMRVVSPYAFVRRANIVVAQTATSIVARWHA